MYTVGLLKQNLYEEVPNYYHWTVIQLLKLTTSDKLKQFVLIAQVYGGLIFQHNDVFILMITEVRGGLVSKLLNLHGQFLGTTFYSLTPTQFYSIVSHKIHRSSYGIGIIVGDAMA